MTDEKLEVVTRLNEAIEEIVDLTAQFANIGSEFEAEQAELRRRYDELLEPVNKRLSLLKERVRQDVQNNRPILIEGDRQSFTTLSGTFQLLHPAAKLTILDKKAVLEICRKERFIRKVAVPPRMKWTLNYDMFVKWYEKNSAYHHLFDGYIQNPIKRETLIFYLNAARFIRVHDGKRVKIESVPISNVEMDSAASDEKS